MKCLSPLVSIITPSYNKGSFIEETILSIRHQTYSLVEHIIIDACSVDETTSILEKYQEVINYVSEPDSGQTNAINKGLFWAKGEIIAYLNADDLYTPDAVQIVVDFFKDHPDVDMCYGDVIHINENSEYINIYKTGNVLLENYLTGQTYIPQPAVFFRKKVIESIGYFDEKLNLAMDMDYWIRIFLSLKTMYIPKPLAKARIYSKAKSNIHRLNYLEERLYILDKTFSDEMLVKKYFNSEKKFNIVKVKSYSSIHFFGGLEYLREGKFAVGFYHTCKGIELSPRHIFNPYLYWSIFISFCGFRFWEKIKVVFPRKDELKPILEYYLEE